MDETQDQLTRIELAPNLEHCVQTRAKQEYAATMSKIMSGDSSPGLEPRLELLKAFLEEADFGRLRRESEEHLTQGRKVKFVLSGSAGPGKWSARMVVGDSA
ncbi:MAG: hypothetical protein JW753_08555 [Dehalococcoidia bacterium]|nr:hypothetical protein [Dehalococcoidia bacterium]